MDAKTNKARRKVKPGSRFRVGELKKIADKKEAFAKLNGAQASWLQSVIRQNAPGQVVSCDETTLANVERSTGEKIHRETVSGQSEPRVEPSPNSGKGSQK
jgi:hypothetical protein